MKRNEKEQEALSAFINAATVVARLEQEVDLATWRHNDALKALNECRQRLTDAEVMQAKAQEEYDRIREVGPTLASLIKGFSTSVQVGQAKRRDE